MKSKGDITLIDTIPVLLDRCQSRKIDRHRVNLQWTGCGPELVPRPRSILTLNITSNLITVHTCHLLWLWSNVYKHSFTRFQFYSTEFLNQLKTHQNVGNVIQPSNCRWNTQQTQHQGHWTDNSETPVTSRDHKINMEMSNSNMQQASTKITARAGQPTNKHGVNYFYYQYIRLMAFFQDNTGKPAPEKQNHSGKTNLDLLEQEIVSKIKCKKLRSYCLVIFTRSSADAEGNVPQTWKIAHEKACFKDIHGHRY